MTVGDKTIKSPASPINKDLLSYRTLHLSSSSLTEPYVCLHSFFVFVLQERFSLVFFHLFTDDCWLISAMSLRATTSSRCWSFFTRFIRSSLFLFYKLVFLSTKHVFSVLIFFSNCFFFGSKFSNCFLKTCFQGF